MLAWLAFINSHKSNKGGKTLYLTLSDMPQRPHTNLPRFFYLCQGQLHHLLHALARCYCYPCLSGKLFLSNTYYSLSSLKKKKKKHCNASSSLCKSNANVFT